MRREKHLQMHDPPSNKLSSLHLLRHESMVKETQQQFVLTPLQLQPMSLDEEDSMQAHQLAIVDLRQTVDSELTTQEMHNPTTYTINQSIKGKKIYEMTDME